MRGVWGLLVTLAIVLSSTSTKVRANVCDFDLRLVHQQNEMPVFSPNATGLAVVVIIHRDGKVLMHQRKSGFWGFAGGKYDPEDSTIAECARRETREETGLEIKNLKFLKLQTSYVEEQQKYFRIAVISAEVDPRAEPTHREPEKGRNWTWFLWDQLPSPLFPPNQELIESGFNPFD